MFCLISAIVIILITGFPHHSMGYKWLTLKPNDTMPNNAVKLNGGTYVGRAVHCNLVLPAEVHNTTNAITFYNDKQITKSQFEVLTATEHCEWKKFFFFKDVSSNGVLAGSAWNNEPIYIGKVKSPYLDYIASILLNTYKFNAQTTDYHWEKFVLICDVNDTWIETSSGNLPKNAVSSGTGKYFIGRLLGPSFWVVGKVIPQKKITIAEYGKIHMESLYTQVLVGETDQYKWVSSKFGKIPDYAVSCEPDYNELRYIVKLDRVLTQRVPSELREFPSYEVLVRNV